MRSDNTVLIKVKLDVENENQKKILIGKILFNARYLIFLSRVQWKKFKDNTRTCYCRIHEAF